MNTAAQLKALSDENTHQRAKIDSLYGNQIKLLKELRDLATVSLQVVAKRPVMTLIVAEERIGFSIELIDKELAKIKLEQGKHHEQ